MTKKKGAKIKLREHFLKNVGRIMNSEELREISGNQSEWARRIRELRSEEGYQILTHNDRSELKPGEYLLEDPKPQPAFERTISKESRAFVLDRNGFTCQMCGAIGVDERGAVRRGDNRVGTFVDYYGAACFGGIHRNIYLRAFTIRKKPGKFTAVGGEDDRARTGLDFREQVLGIIPEQCQGVSI